MATENRTLWLPSSIDQDRCPDNNLLPFVSGGQRRWHVSTAAVGHGHPLRRLRPFSGSDPYFGLDQRRPARQRQERPGDFCRHGSDGQRRRNVHSILDARISHPDGNLRVGSECGRRRFQQRWQARSRGRRWRSRSRSTWATATALSRPGNGYAIDRQYGRSERGRSRWRRQRRLVQRDRASRIFRRRSLRNATRLMR